MKTFKDRRGFTLIELLAVIVVLAIVMVLATTTVLPLMTSARKKTFVLEANAARETASQVVSLIAIGTTDGLNIEGSKAADYQANADKTAYCFSLKFLAKTGLWKKDLKYVDDKDGTVTPEYEGKVVVKSDSSDSNKYTYTITMHNKSLYIPSINGTVEEKNVENYGTQDGFGCTENDVK